MRTGEFLQKVAISESTLRRWIRNGRPIPELSKVKRDWTGQRDWTNDHVHLVLTYKRQREKGLNRSAD